MKMHKIKSRRHPALLCAAGLALGLSACTVPAEGPFHFAENRPGPAVFDIDASFRPGSTELTAEEAGLLRQRVVNTLVRPQDQILIYVGTTGVPEVDAARQASARAALTGVPGRQQVIPLPQGSPDFGPDLVAIQVRRNASLVVGCPNQGTDFVDQAYGRDTLTMGCTNAINIASMANNPRELASPGRLVGSDASASVGAVNRYRADEVKAYTPLRSPGEGF